ncbi:mitochondrial CIV assembly protein Cox20 [Andalucia godoyi]|uniref:Cytochrome c oxidase assembly protein COX20, mitochondrial n=1 Tax=Andalucia godoyi TaxID=505711 RepID=A0A8K0AK15_ANDGO|nr:mitochondrial CIV assembly protein Cox20 [Andalucia godoyi]|eukprot:ANDGO_08810.mRNA.1 mitochondrial CIV assembly protein Cox20
MSSQMPTASNSSNDAELPSFLNLMNLVRVPCFRQAMLGGIWVGAAWGGFSYLRNRNIMQACNTAVFAWAGMSGLSWVICRVGYREKRDKLRHAVEEMNSSPGKMVVVQNLPGDDLVEAVRTGKAKAAEYNERK